MVAHRRPALVLTVAALLWAGSAAWPVALSLGAPADPADGSTGDGTLVVHEDANDPVGSVVSGEIAREVRRAIAEAMAGVEEALAEVHDLSVQAEPLDDGRGRVRIRVDRDGDTHEAVIDPVEIQRHVQDALDAVDFDRLGSDLERSMDQLGTEMGRLGEDLGRAFEDSRSQRERAQQLAARARAQAQRERTGRRAQQLQAAQLDREIHRLEGEIEALQREIARLKAQQSRGGSRHYD